MGHARHAQVPDSLLRLQPCSRDGVSGAKGEQPHDAPTLQRNQPEHAQLPCRFPRSSSGRADSATSPYFHNGEGTMIEFILSIYWYLAAAALYALGMLILEVLERRSET